MQTKERNERGGNGDAPVTSSGLGKESSNFWWARKRERLLEVYRLLNSLESVTPPFILLKRGVTVSNNNFTTSNGTILKSSLLESPTYSVKLKKLFWSVSWNPALNENVGSDWEAISLLFFTGSINYRKYQSFVIVFYLVTSSPLYFCIFLMFVTVITVHFWRCML